MKTTCSWRQKGIPPPTRRLLNRLLAKADELCGSCVGTLALNFLGASEMAHANQDCLGHSGSTDVITLDYREGQPMPGDDGMVELLICPDQALSEGHRQGGYPREMVLYIVHGLLHASGEDDLSPLPRRRMRRREREVLSQLEKEFDFDKIFQTPKES